MLIWNPKILPDSLAIAWTARLFWVFNWHWPLSDWNFQFLLVFFFNFIYLFLDFMEPVVCFWACLFLWILFLDFRWSLAIKKKWDLWHLFHWWVKVLEALLLSNVFFASGLEAQGFKELHRLKITIGIIIPLLIWYHLWAPAVLIQEILVAEIYWFSLCVAKLHGISEVLPFRFLINFRESACGG